MAKARKKAEPGNKTQSSKIRIIGGEWRSRLLPVADLPGLRPTTDRVRETVFNWLQFEVPAAHCLDVFAGSGVLGFEAASRGAKQVVMLESNLQAVKCLREASELLSDQKDRIQIIQTDALVWLGKPADQTFDLIFLDPPFADELLDESIQKLISNNWLKDDSLIYIERDKKQMIDLPATFHPEKEKQAGQVSFALYRYCPSSLS